MKKLLAVVLLMFSVNALATTTVSGKVARIYPMSDRVHFNLKSDQCGLGIDQHYYYFILDSDVKKAWYSLILAAANSDKPIVVSLHDCPAPGAQAEVRYIYQDF